MTTQSRPKSKNPVLAFILSLIIPGLGNYFYVGTHEQKKIGRNYFLFALSYTIIVFVVYMIFDIQENSHIDTLFYATSRALGTAFSIITGMSAYRAAKKLNEQNKKIETTSI